jgi:DnaK suppressor protein
MDPARARELLSQEKARILRELERLAPPERDAEPEPRDRADQGDDLFEEERDAGLAEAFRERLATIERAEGRLEEGTYGLSVVSDKPIPEARLEADPAAELTVEEQRERERGRL